MKRLLLALLSVEACLSAYLNEDGLHQKQKKLDMLTAKKLNASSTGACSNAHLPGVHTVQIQSSGKTRTFEIFVPTGLVANQERPAIFMWHGYGSSPQKVMDFTQINTFSQTERWIAIYPVGTGLIKGFNGAGCCPGANDNDVQFAKDIIAYLQSNMCLDSSRVYSTGFSNGGFMTNRLACEAADLFRGFAIHSGLLGKDFTCNPSKGVPILMIHGDADSTVPIYGNGQWKAFAEVAEHWVEKNTCGDESNARPSYTTDTTTCIRYDSCGRNGVPFEYCSVVGLAHFWSGERNFDVEATAYLFNFMKNLG